MRLTISETAKLAGVSIRTLHYYDEIGLLKPSEVEKENGYRYYREAEIERLQQILFYRELDFSLKDILHIMETPDYKKEDALRRQRELLLLKRDRLNRLLTLLDQNLKGENTMSFEEFDMTHIEVAKKKYEAEIKKRWGSTKAYEENQQKTEQFTKKDWADSNGEMERLLKAFSKQVGKAPESEVVQQLVEEWRTYITNYHYTCTKEILAGLGQMYMADERFLKNMDQYKEGTTKLISEAIEIYCKKE